MQIVRLYIGNVIKRADYTQFVYKYSVAGITSRFHSFSFILSTFTSNIRKAAGAKLDITFKYFKHANFVFILDFML